METRNLAFPVNINIVYVGIQEKATYKYVPFNFKWNFQSFCFTETQNFVFPAVLWKIGIPYPGYARIQIREIWRISYIDTETDTPYPIFSFEKQKYFDQANWRIRRIWTYTDMYTVYEYGGGSVVKNTDTLGYGYAKFGVSRIRIRKFLARLAYPGYGV